MTRQGIGRLAKYSALLALSLFLILIGLPSRGEPAPWAYRSTQAVMWQSASAEVAISEPVIEPITQVALSWDGEAPSFAAVRLLRDDKWGPWLALTLSNDHGPDPGTSEHSRSVQSSELMWTEPADGAQFMTTGGTESAEATLIDTTDRTKPLTQKAKDLFEFRPSPAEGAPSQPAIQPRSSWDPSGACQPTGGPDFVQVTHAFVHHTTGPNNYTDPAARVLAICLFHTQSRGWDDIGYNFLIDRFGTIWEGRAGGITNGVQGAHTAGFNSYSTGVAFIGEHTNTPPTAAAEAALKQLLAWKFGVHNVDPTNSSVLVSKGSSKWSEGYPVLMKPIMGHRDAQSTSCPGEACYARMPSYQVGVDALWNQVPLSIYSNPLIADFDGDGSDEGGVFRRADGTWRVTQPNGSTGVWADFSTAAGWTRQIVGDFNGDGRDDIANYHPSNGTWWVSRSSGSSFQTNLWADFSTATGWTSQIVGDFNGDGRDDIANYHPSNGTWWVSRSTGNGFTTSLWADFSTATGWTNQIVGDFDGDGRDDIANHHGASGNWWVGRSTGGGLSVSFWGRAHSPVGLSAVVSRDVNNDGRTDLVAIDAYNGFIRRHRSTGTSFAIETLADTPWRTTIGYPTGRTDGDDTLLVYFGQEFQWVRITNLGGSSAQAGVIYSLPRS